MIAELKDIVTERESLVKKLVVSVCTQYKMAYRMPFVVLPNNPRHGACMPVYLQTIVDQIMECCSLA